MAFFVRKVYFVKIFICDALSKLMCPCMAQTIRGKSLDQVQKLPDKFNTKKTQEAVLNVEMTVTK